MLHFNFILIYRLLYHTVSIHHTITTQPLDAGDDPDDDMNSWLLINGPMAGISDDNPGGWQYGSHLMEGAPPSLLEDAPPLDAAPQAEPQPRELAARSSPA